MKILGFYFSLVIGIYFFPHFHAPQCNRPTPASDAVLATAIAGRSPDVVRDPAECGAEHGSAGIGTESVARALFRKPSDHENVRPAGWQSGRTGNFPEDSSVDSACRVRWTVSARAISWQRVEMQWYCVTDQLIIQPIPAGLPNGGWLNALPVCVYLPAIK